MYAYECIMKTQCHPLNKIWNFLCLLFSYPYKDIFLLPKFYLVHLILQKQINSAQQISRDVIYLI